MDKIEQIKNLVQELNRYSYEYYVLNNTSISDKEYDEKYDKLLKLEKETSHIESNSPTLRVGDKILEGFKKVQHKNKLWSLDKAQKGDDKLKKFYNGIVKYCKQNNLPKPKFVVTKKFDGLTIKAEYNETGELAQSSTRGTGETGEDITEQSKTIVNLPHKINCNYHIEPHGEALMTKRAFNDYNKSAKEPLKNLRNGAAGALRNLNIKECARRKLSVFFYNINYIESKKFETYSQQLEFLKECGLPVADYKLCDTFEEIFNEIDNIKNQRSNLEFDIDGVVIAVDDMKTRDMLGFTIKFPKYALAYKYESEEATTTILDIEWNTGRSGKITPKALVEPVELAGVTVKQATLNNYDDIKRKNVKLGGRVFIRRSNDVIPEIMGNADDEGTEIQPPTHCRVCGSESIKDGVHYFCPNTLGCKAQTVKSIVHYCQREAMNIDGFSEKGVELFFDNGIINNVLDLYTLENKKEQIINLPKFGVKKYNNLIESINKSKECDLSAFIFGLGIEGVGKKSAKDLVEFLEGETSNKKFININFLTVDKLLKMDDCGEITANNIVNYFNNQTNKDMINKLLNYITFKEEKINEVKIENTNNPLYGKFVYCTGKFSLKKDELKTKLAQIGCTFESSYKKSLDYLILGGDTSKSGKADKAAKDGVKMMTEDEMLKWLK